MRAIATDIGFLEGPVWTGERLLVTSIDRGCLYEVPLDGAAASPAFRTEGGPNGSALAPDGSVWVTQNGGHVLTREPHPVVPPGLQRWDDTSCEYVLQGDVQAPNDLAFARDGSLWFTDPPATLDRVNPHRGTVRRRSTNGELSIVAGDLFHPNGIAISPDGAWVYVTDTVQRAVFRTPVASTGGAWKHFATTTGEPDGMAFDAAGRLLVACHGAQDAVVLLGPDGGIVEMIDLTGAFLTNVCFAGPDRSTLVVTAADRVLAIERDVPGIDPLTGA